MAEEHALAQEKHDLVHATAPDGFVAWKKKFYA
jgi:hypothetical protein